MTKVFLLLYSVLDFVIFQSFCFNIDIDNPIIYLDQTQYINVKPSNKSSFFGLSVILYPGDKGSAPWVQIGAPRGNSPNVKYQDPGTVFRCKIGGSCRNLEVDLDNGENTKLDGAWIGATMDINLNTNRSVICAPRWINILQRRPKDYRMYGACYWSHLNSMNKFHKKLPLYGYNGRDTYVERNTNLTVYNYGQGESGFSVHMPESGKEFLIGAPGVFNWKGTAILYKDPVISDIDLEVSRYSAIGSQRQEDKLTDAEIFYDGNVANAIALPNILGFDLFGYAVSSGYFYSETKLYYVGGAPRSKNYFGQVLIYEFRRTDYQVLNVKESKQGTQFGEYFGASVAVGDINNDGLDDLFVGAPFYKGTKFNEGRMYLFLGSKKDTLQEPLSGEIVSGSPTSGQFGTTITYLGDMNSDASKRYTEKPKYVAVSAPYEEDTGVVYIFKGNSYGLDPVPVQRIVGKSILANLKGFGISISKPADIDENGFGDIAIGAYQSGHTVLLRSRPLVTVETFFARTPSAISNEIKEFEVTICHRYYSYMGMPSIKIHRKIFVDEDFNRASLKVGAIESNLTIYESRPMCENVTIKLRESWPNAYDPLTLKVTHTFIAETAVSEKIIVSDGPNGIDHFCQRCGVYDESTSTKTVHTTVPFILGCGSDNICTSSLHFASGFKGIGVRNDTFILGATNVIELETTVENSGEKAYLLRVQVDLPKELSFKQTPTLCEQNRTRIICALANPLNKLEKKSLSLKLDMDYINKRVVEDFVTISVTVLTNSENTNAATRTVMLNFKTEADISISGKSSEQSYSYGNGSNSKVPFEQIYQIGKYGLSPVSTIRFEIMIPYAIKTGSGNISFVSLYQPEGYLEGGQSLIFNSEFDYLEEHKLASTEDIGQEKPEEIRIKRATDFSKVNFLMENTSAVVVPQNSQTENTDSQLLGNKRFEINCNMTEVLCKKIYGKTGPFEGSKKSAVLQIRMLFDIQAVSGLLNKNSVIRYSSYGLVEIEDPPHLIQSGKRPDSVFVSSLFVNDGVKKKIDTWIIIVSIISGLLLLLLLILGLIKAGFFKRTKKEELEQLKAQSGIENSGAMKEVDDKTDPDST